MSLDTSLRCDVCAICPDRLNAGAAATNAAAVCNELNDELISIDRAYKRKKLSPVAFSSKVRNIVKTLKDVATACDGIGTKIANGGHNSDLKRVHSQLAAQERTLRRIEGAACSPITAIQLFAAQSGSTTRQKRHRPASKPATHQQLLDQQGVLPPQGAVYSKAEMSLYFTRAHESGVHGAMKRLHVAISALGYTRHKYDRCTKLRSVNGGGRPLGKTGRPCKFGELEDLFAAVHAQYAAVANFDLNPVTMRAIIEELVAARVHAGLCSVDTSVTTRDVNHYIKTCCANRKGFAVNGKKKQNTIPQQIASQSMIDAVAHASQTLAAAVVLGAPPYALPDGYKRSLAYSVMNKVVDGAPHALAEIMLNVDDLGIHARPSGEAISKSQWISVTKAPTPGDRSRFTPVAHPSAPTGKEFSAGLTVRGSMCTSSEGLLADPFFTIFVDKTSIVGVASGIVLLQVPGLHANAQSPTNQGHGYICFAVRGDGMNREPAVTKAFINAAVKPFVAAIRKGKGWVEGTPIPSWLRALLFMDGKQEQIQAVTDPALENSLMQLDIDVLKHGAACSLLHQANDAAPIHKHHRAFTNSVSCTAGPELGLQRLVSKMLREDPRLKINAPDIAAIGFFMGKQVAALPRAYTTDNIRRGWINTGAVSRTGNYPDVHHMLTGNLRRPVKSAELAHALKVLPDTTREYLDRGGVDVDAAWTAVHGLAHDYHPVTGDVVTRDSACISRQRAQHLSHPVKLAAREQGRAFAKAAAAEQASAAINAASAVLSEHDWMAEEIAKVASDCLPAPVSKAEWVAVIYKAASGKAKRLKSFVLARRFGSQAAATVVGYKDVKRGTVADAVAGGDNTLARAYAVLNRPRLWKASAQPAAPLPPPTALPTALPAPNVVSTAPPSTADLLASQEWRALADSTFGAPATAYAGDAEAVTRATTLHRLLGTRLTSHIRAKAKHKLSYVWDHFRDNLPCLAALAVYYGFIVEQLEYATDFSCLLSEATNFTALAGEGLLEIGAYLFWDGPVCVRSGACCGTDASLGERLKAHEKAALLLAAKDQTKFYLRYALSPSPSPVCLVSVVAVARPPHVAQHFIFCLKLLHSHPQVPA